MDELSEQPDGNQHGIYWDKAYVIGKLRQLDLAEAILRAAVLVAVRHIFDCTTNDPPALAGMLGWGKGIRSLREQLIPQGWNRRNTRNFATIEHPKGWCALTIAAGDAFTGLHDKNPSTRSAKGQATADAIRDNRPEFADVSGDFPRVQEKSIRDTWFLLYYIDNDEQQTRMELSRPAGMTEDGHVTVWSERIILDADAFPTQPQADLDDDREDDSGPDIDVVRKTG